MSDFSFDDFIPNVFPQVCQQLSNELYEVQDDIRQLQVTEAALKMKLAAHLSQLATKDDPLPEVIGQHGQRYRLSRSNPNYKFKLPKVEYERLGILRHCTPAPKMTKGQMDDFLKHNVINHADIARWSAEGWYSKEDGGELSVQQLKSKES